MTEELNIDANANVNTYKFKFEYDNSDESKYIRQKYGNKYLQETDKTVKAILEYNIKEFYRVIEIDKAYFERFKKIKNKEYILSNEENDKAISIIKEAYPECETNEQAKIKLKSILLVYCSSISRVKNNLKLYNEIKNICKIGKYDSFTEIYGYRQCICFYEDYTSNKGLFGVYDRNRCIKKGNFK